MLSARGPVCLGTGTLTLSTRAVFQMCVYVSLKERVDEGRILIAHLPLGRDPPLSRRPRELGPPPTEEYSEV